MDVITIELDILMVHRNGLFNDYSISMYFINNFFAGGTENKPFFESVVRKTPNEGRSGVRNIVYPVSPRYTIIHTPLQCTATFIGFFHTPLLGLRTDEY